jgi:hypothetical protein
VDLGPLLSSSYASLFAQEVSRRVKQVGWELMLLLVVVVVWGGMLERGLYVAAADAEVS